MSDEYFDFWRDVLRKLEGSENPDPWNDKSYTLHDLGCFEETLQTYGESIYLETEDAATWYNKGNTLHALGRFEEALQACEEAIRLDPEYASAWTYKGVTLGKLGHFEEALQAFEEAIRLDPENVAPWTNKGVALYKLGRFEEALQAYEEAIRLDPEYASAWNGKGVVLDDLGRFEEALQAYEEAIRLDPKFAFPWNNKGKALNALGRPEEALQAYNEAIRLEPEYTGSWNNKGKTLNDLGRFEEALQACEEAIRLAPKDAIPWNNKGNALRGLERFGEALQAYNEAIRLDRRYAVAYFNRALLLFDYLDSPKEALASVRKALGWERNDIDFWLLAARISMALGMEERADQALQHMLRLLSPGDSLPSQSTVRSFLQALGHSTLALHAVSIDLKLTRNKEWNAYLHEIKDPVEAVLSLYHAATLLGVWEKNDASAENALWMAARAHGLLHEICGDRISARNEYAMGLKMNPESRATRYFWYSTEAFFNGWLPKNKTTDTYDDIRLDAQNLLAAGGSPEDTLFTALTLLLDDDPNAKQENFGLARSLLQKHPNHAPSLAFLGHIAYVKGDTAWEPYIKACLELEKHSPEEHFFFLREQPPDFPTLNAALAAFPECFFRLALLHRFTWLDAWREEVREGEIIPTEDGREIFGLWEAQAKDRQETAEEDTNGYGEETAEQDSPFAARVLRLPQLLPQAKKELLIAHVLLAKAQKADKFEKKLLKSHRGLLNSLGEVSGDAFLSRLDNEVNCVGDAGKDPEILINLVFWSVGREKIPLREAVYYILYLEKKNRKISRFIKRAATTVIVASAVNAALSGVLTATGLRIVVATTAAPLFDALGRVAVEAFVAELFCPKVDKLTHAREKNWETMADFRNFMRGLDEGKTDP